MAEKQLNFAQKMVCVQNELKARKDQYNKFGNFDYRNAEGILESVKPLLKKYELQLKISEEIVEICGSAYVRSTVTVTNAEDGAFDSASSYAREAKDKKGMDVSQMTGSATSYARKYALNGLFAIDNSEYDPDGSDNGPAPQQPRSKGVPRKSNGSSENQEIKALYAKIERVSRRKKEAINAALKKRLGVSDLRRVNKQQIIQTLRQVAAEFDPQDQPTAEAYTGDWGS